MPSTPRTTPHRLTPAAQNRNVGITVILIIVILTTGLVLGGVAPATAVGTLSAAGLAAVEIMRRLTAIPETAPHHG